jgi:hypothetical protein
MKAISRLRFRQQIRVLATRLAAAYAAMMVTKSRNASLLNKDAMAMQIALATKAAGIR